ncbi:hypothetical protein [Wolbachia endosymbiont (group A) of Sicus ferrugineus]|uniref:hypothetical protein n=1 Tax=Wolbachia endosymbiont (group A) of Sicus ferrugineus TaxID=2954056 RepID=UPI00222E2F67|nr:hypothetical protein [Wolbachia endosymbiont (group A) of Sicus ferrugineus]
MYSRFHGTKVSSPEEQFKREDGSKPSMQELTRLDYLDLATSKNLNHLNVDISSLKSKSVENCNAKSGDEKDTKISSPESQPGEKEETKVNDYVNQAIGVANWLAGQATKAMSLPYVFYNYATTPVSASLDDVNITKSFVTDSSITSPVI